MKWIRLPALICIVLASAAAYGDHSSRFGSPNNYAASSQLNRAYGPTLAQPTAAQSEESPSDAQPLDAAPADAAPAEELIGDDYGYPFYSRCCEKKPHFAASMWSGYCAEKRQRVPHMGGKHCGSCGGVACGGNCGGRWSSWRMGSDCGCQEPVASCCPPLFDFHWLHGHLHLRGKHCRECDCCGTGGEEVQGLPTPPPEEAEGEGESVETSAMYHGGRYDGTYDDAPIIEGGPLMRLQRRLFGAGPYASEGPYDGQIIIESEVDTQLVRPQPSDELQPQNVRLRQPPADGRQQAPSLRRQQDYEPTTEAMIQEAPEGSLLDRLFGPTRKLYGSGLAQ
jgi:hypothetical protein